MAIRRLRPGRLRRTCATIILTIELLHESRNASIRSPCADSRAAAQAYGILVTIKDQNRAGYAAELAQKIDNKSPDRWLTAEQCERELGLDSK